MVHRKILLLCVLLCVVICGLLAACGGKQDGSGGSGGNNAWNVKGLSEKETFTWGEQGIRFGPPSGDKWTRHRWQQGGLEGVSFQIRRTPAGRILVADYRSLYRKHYRIGSNSGRVDFEPASPNATIDDVLDRVLFDPASLPDPQNVVMGELREREVGGERAFSLDYTWHDGRNPLFGREVYVLSHGSLFVVTLLGKESDEKLFEKIVTSIEFPEPEEQP